MNIIEIAQIEGLMILTVEPIAQFNIKQNLIIATRVTEQGRQYIYYRAPNDLDSYVEDYDFFYHRHRIESVEYLVDEYNKHISGLTTSN